MAKRIRGTVPMVETQFYIRRKNVNFYLFSGVSLLSSSPIIPAAIMNPIMHPIGIASPPSAVESALSLSPNQALANLLDELMKNPCPNAATVVPIKEYPKLSKTCTNYLSQAPTSKKQAPIVTHERSPYFV